MLTKTKVLNVLTVVDDGGMETLVSNIYSGLARTNEFEFYICILVKSNEKFIFQKLKCLSKEMIVLGIKNKELSLFDYLRLFQKLFGLARYISSSRIDIVNSHDFFSGVYTRLAVFISRFVFFYSPKGNFVTLHNLFFWLGKKHHFLNRLLSNGTNKIICVSRSVFEYSFKNDNIKLEKYKIILNGIDEKQFLPDDDVRVRYRTDFGFINTDFIIGNIGTLSIRKGHIYLVKAINDLVQIFPNIKLLIFGSSRGHELAVKDEVTDYIIKNKLHNHVLFFDSRDDINNIYNMFDVFVMSSVSEGLSLAAIEAMLMRRVCLFSDIGPFKELVIDKENGFLFKSRDSEDLRSKLSDIISNYDSYRNVGRNARNSIIENFNYERMIGEYSSLYRCEN